jgi:deoxyribose-phosphate aldolase
MAPNKTTNRKLFLNVPNLENAAAMAAANIRPLQAALFTQTSTGELSTEGQITDIQGFSRMAQDLMNLSPEGTAPPPDMSLANRMLNYLKKMVHHLSVSIILRMQKKFVVKEARLHEPKAIRWMTG